MFKRRSKTAPPTADSPPPGLMQYRSALREVRALPRDVGWMLLISGLAVDVVTPGTPPFWVFGVLILWPHTGLKLTAPIHKRYPKVFKGSLNLINRYVQDLDKRYPQKKKPVQQNAPKRLRVVE